MSGARRVLLRAHSGPEVGMGHVMRSRAVARAVHRLGGEPLLVVDDERTVRALAGEPYAVCLAGGPRTDPACETRWLDGFLPWREELARAREECAAVFLVENRIADRSQAQRVVYPALHFIPDHWDRAHPSRVLAGAGAVPLAEDILTRDAVSSRDVDLLVTFGGSDPNHLTERVLPLLAERGGHVVVGVGHHMVERRRDLCLLAARIERSDLRVSVLEPGTPLAPWMARAREALTALGTTLYELAYLGVPARILANYEEDREALAWYRRHGPHLPLGVHGDLTDSELREQLASDAVVGPCPRPEGLGEGAGRLARELLAA